MHSIGGEGLKIGLNNLKHRYLHY